MKPFLIAIAASVFAVSTGASTRIDTAQFSKCKSFAMQTSPDVASARAVCTPLADLGLPAAQFALGAVLVNSEGLESKDGVQWLEKAAATGHPPSHFFLTTVYASSQDEEKRGRAREYMRSAVCSGYPAALRVLEKENVQKTALNCEPEQPGFDGVWTLKLQSAKPSPVGTTDFDYRVEVTGATAKAFLLKDGKWTEFKPGSFKTQQLDDTLVVTSLTSGWDLDGKWIESWVFQILRLSADTAAVTFTRTVNNPHLPSQFDYRTFTIEAEGNATRSKE